MKFKTLKDIKQCGTCFVEDFEDDEHSCMKDNIRKEAINQIKELRSYKFYCCICEEFDCDCSSSDCFKFTSEKVEEYIKWANNIKEDELK